CLPAPQSRLTSSPGSPRVQASTAGWSGHPASDPLQPPLRHDTGRGSHIVGRAAGDHPVLSFWSQQLRSEARSLQRFSSHAQGPRAILARRKPDQSGTDVTLVRILVALRLTGLLAALAALVCPLPAVAQHTPDIPYERFVLANGLTVIVHEDHKAPI